ncbi:hypothetical protein TL16_g01047 [Triparma laevis f. inornata]|uniref:SRCR domain-containing protein n=1 Tax=Triparma laevis f. inornata TaxID=1714386 RepID=A0A9W7DRH3_9STRA|nr:hypothetical protein TL16_g01047 [Triparma laevis f. inornata]
MGRLLDARSVRLRDLATGRKPKFDSEGVVEGVVEVKPSNETAWGRIGLDVTLGANTRSWDSFDAVVACREIANDLNFVFVSAAAFSITKAPAHRYSNTKFWWANVGCTSDEQTLESCSKTQPIVFHQNTYTGVKCEFVEAHKCEECLKGMFSGSLVSDDALFYSHPYLLSNTTVCQAARRYILQSL